MNYHHLLYFWVVAREGGLAPAGKLLSLSHSTLSTQIRTLEANLGEDLFSRGGRRLTLTETGQTVFRYADEIFSLGQEMLEAVRGESESHTLRLNVGVADVIPKLVVRRMLGPTLGLAEPVRLVCHEDTHERLLAELALHTLHVVISDAPVPPGSPVRAYNHLLGDTGVSLLASPDIARAHAPGFPASLDGAPFLLPLETLTLRRALNVWFDRHRVSPRIVAEFEDSALFKVFGADGMGIFPVPTVIEEAVIARYGVALVGRPEGVSERFYAITAERRLEHPGVVALLNAARQELLTTDLSADR